MEEEALRLLPEAGPDTNNEIGTDLTVGLTSAQAQQQRRSCGLNIIPAPGVLPAWLCCLLPCLKQNEVRKYFEICVPEYSCVRRNGRWMTLDATQVVIGDIMRLQSGDRAAAGILLLQVSC